MDGHVDVDGGDQVAQLAFDRLEAGRRRRVDRAGPAGAPGQQRERGRRRVRGGQRAPGPGRGGDPTRPEEDRQRSLLGGGGGVRGERRGGAEDVAEAPAQAGLRLLVVVLGPLGVGLVRHGGHGHTTGGAVGGPSPPPPPAGVARSRRTMTDLEVGVLLPSAVLSSGTSTLASGK